MHIIAFGDIHMATDRCRDIPGIHEADLILLTGDLTNFGSRKETKKVLDEVMSHNPNVLAQFGNLDHPEINDYLEQLDINLHGQSRLVQGKLCIVGVGGSNPTPFRTPSEFSEDELTAIAGKAYRQGLEYIALAEPVFGNRIPILLVSHVPPANTLIDRLRHGRHVGSMAIRRLIEEYQPDLCISGHIHEAKGTDTIGRTTVMNPGMFRDGGWIDIRLFQSTLQATLQ
jgi:Icc-related predicted phosphoesterase